MLNTFSPAATLVDGEALPGAQALETTAPPALPAELYRSEREDSC